MKEQNIGNHTQIVYGYYITTGLPIVALIVLAIRRLLADEPSATELNVMLLLVGWILLMLLFRARSFALKAQDRAIRAEESLRYYQLTGKPIDNRLTIGQIIALRFASDEEMPALAQKAAGEGLSNKAIKQQIKNWRADWYRV